MKPPSRQATQERQEKIKTSSKFKEPRSKHVLFLLGVLGPLGDLAVLL